MKRFFSSLLFVLTAGVLATAGTAQAATQTENVYLSISDFTYESNFFAGFPGATVGGPPPVTQVDLVFTMAYQTPIAQAFDFGLRTPSVSAFRASITTQDIPGFSQAGAVVTSATQTMQVQRTIRGGVTEHDLQGRVDIFTSAASLAAPLISLEFFLPGFFNPLPGSGQEWAEYAYDSPKPFDAPFYRADATAGSLFTVNRTVAGVVASPVPVPASLLLGLSGLGLLLGMRRRH